MLYTGDMVSDGRERKAALDFSELRHLCDRDYPADISSNLDVLYRLVLRPSYVPKRPGRLNWLREIVAARHLSEYRYIRSWLERKQDGHAKPPQRPVGGSVLATFDPCRSDLQALFHPVTNILSERGVATYILVPRRRLPGGVDRRLFSGSHFLVSDDFYSFGAYRRARKHYGRLEPWLDKLCSQLELSRQQTHWLRTLFQKYTADREIFRTVLTLVQPSVVYGLHYIEAPGYLAAMDEMRAGGTRPIKLLIQHGAFASGEFHDFKGADCVILWGDYFRDVLNSQYLIPIPQCKVIGNPKLEVELRKRREGNASNEPAYAAKNKNAVLFVSSLDEIGEDYDKKALSLFANSLRTCPGQWNVLYKPHPEDDLAVYRSLVQNGFIRQEQIARRDASTYELIARADVVVGTSSTVIVEAAGLGKPVIQVLPDMSKTDWGEYGLLGVSGEEELRVALNEILCSAEYRSKVVLDQRTLVERMFGKIVGSSQDTANYIMTLL